MAAVEPGSALGDTGERIDGRENVGGEVLRRSRIDRGFIERTSAAIVVLLIFLLVMNGIAIYLRNRFEKRW